MKSAFTNCTPNSKTKESMNQAFKKLPTTWLKKHSNSFIYNYLNE